MNFQDTSILIKSCPTNSNNRMINHRREESQKNDNTVEYRIEEVLNEEEEGTATKSL